jgi:hypothetical protein
VQSGRVERQSVAVLDDRDRRCSRPPGAGERVVVGDQLDGTGGVALAGGWVAVGRAGVVALGGHPRVSSATERDELAGGGVDGVEGVPRVGDAVAVPGGAIALPVGGWGPATSSS